MKLRFAPVLMLLIALIVVVWVLFGDSPTADSNQDSQRVEEGLSPLEAGTLGDSKGGLQTAAGLQRGELDPGSYGEPSFRPSDGIPSFFGRVVDSKGHPLQGVDIKAFGLLGWADSWNGDPRQLVVSWQTTSDSNGDFEFPKTPRDQLGFLIELQHPGFARLKIGHQSAAMGGSRDLGTLVLGVGFRIQGVVYHPQGNPVAGAVVTPFQDTNLFSFVRKNQRQRPLAEAVITDDHGAFVFEGLPQQQVRLWAEAENLLGNWSSTVHGKHGEAYQGIHIHLQDAQAIQGVVLTPNMTPLAGAQVSAVAGTQKSRGIEGSSSTAVSGADGRFRLTLPKAFERLMISIEAEGYWAEEHAVQQSQIAGPLEFELTALPPLSGVVLDPSESPVAGAQVRLVDANQGMTNPTEQVAISETVCRDDGTFTLAPTFHSKSANQFKVVAFQQGIASGQSESFEMNAASHFEAPELRIVLRSGFPVSGAVLSPDGMPLAAATVLLRALHAAPMGLFGAVGSGPRSGTVYSRTLTTVGGRFHFPGIPAGDYRLEAYSAEYSPAHSSTFQLEESGFETSLALVASSSIIGRVVGAIDAFQGLHVIARSAGMDPLDVPVNAQGGFSLLKILPGIWDLELHESGGTDVSLADAWGGPPPIALQKRIELAAGQTIEVTLQIESEGRVAVSGVATVNGKVALNYSVFLMPVPQVDGGAAANNLFGGGPAVANRQRMATTDFEGRYEFRAVETGEYWLVLCLPGAYPEHRQAGAGTSPTGLFRYLASLRLGTDLEYNFDVLVGSAGFELTQSESRSAFAAELIPELLDGRKSYRFFLGRAGFRIDSLPSGHYRLLMGRHANVEYTSVHVPRAAHVQIFVTPPAETKKPGEGRGGPEEEQGRF